MRNGTCTRGSVVAPGSRNAAASRRIHAPSRLTMVNGGSLAGLSSKSPAPHTARRFGTTGPFARASASAPNAARPEPQNGLTHAWRALACMGSPGGRS